MNAVAEGYKIYKSNPAMRNFANIASHPEFVQFFETYCSNWDDCKTSIMILRTAIDIGKNFKIQTGGDISGYELVGLLKKTLDRSSSRQARVSDMQNFIICQENKNIK